MPFPDEVEVQDITPVLPAGIYDAYFARISEESNDQGTYWLWTFVAKNGDETTEITATSSPKVTPRTKAAKWLAGMGVDVSVGAKVNFSDLFDMPVKLVVIINEQGYSRIESVLPYGNSDAKKK